MTNVAALRPHRRAHTELGVTVARQLRDAEHQLDTALAGKLALGQMLLNGRKEAGFAAAVGQEVLADLARAFTLGVESRAAMVSAHSGLLSVADEHGVDWRMEGPYETKPGETGGIKPKG